VEALVPGMMLTAAAQLRFVASIVFGVRFAPWSLDQLIAAVQDTRREFGALGPDAHELLGPTLDDDTRQEFQQRRFRAQARRAARDTAYYRNLFAQLGVDPAALRYADIAQLPLTTKEAVRSDGEAFVRHQQRPVFRCTTSGATGWPTSIAFSEYELRVSVALSALSALNAGTLRADEPAPPPGSERRSICQASSTPRSRSRCSVSAGRGPGIARRSASSAPTRRIWASWSRRACGTAIVRPTSASSASPAAASW
jgi:hypothetical protein